MRLDPLVQAGRLAWRTKRTIEQAIADAGAQTPDEIKRVKRGYTSERAKDAGGRLWSLTRYGTFKQRMRMLNEVIALLDAYEVELWGEED